MTVSLEGRVALRELLAQAWQEVEGQARGMLKRAVEGLLQAERDRRVSESQQRGEKVYRWGYTVRKCWTTLWGSLEQVRVPRLRGREEIGLAERYDRHGLDQMLFALTVGGLSQRKVVGWVRRFLGGTLSPATIGAVLEQAQQQVEQRRSEAIPAEAVSGRRGGRDLPALSAKCYRQCGADGVSRGPASTLPGALVPQLGSTDAAISVVPATQVPAGVLVDLGRGKPSAGAGLGATVSRALAVVGTGDGGEIPRRAGRRAGLLLFPGTLAPSVAYDQPGRRLVQTFAPLLEPLPRMP
jgi:hypothetical protein